MELNNLNDSELRKLGIEIRSLLRNREVSEEVVKQAVKETNGRFTELTLKLERDGFSREAIASRVVNMSSNGTLKTSSGCPIGVTESDELPIYPNVEGKRYVYICYLK